MNTKKSNSKTSNKKSKSLAELRSRLFAEAYAELCEAARNEPSPSPLLREAFAVVSFLKEQL